MAVLTPDQIKSQYAEALKAHTAGRLEQAMAGYKRVISANPRIAEAHWQMGRIYNAVFRSDLALQSLAAAAALKPSEPAIWQTWAEAVALWGDPDVERSFLADLKKAPIPTPVKIELQDRFGRNRKGGPLRLGPVPREKMVQLGGLLDSHRPAEAEALAKTLTKHYGPAGSVLSIQASALAMLGRKAEAHTVFDQAHKADPRNARAWYNHGILLIDLHRDREAAQALRRVVEMEPSNADALTRLGLALVRSGEPGIAIRYIETAVRLAPDLDIAKVTLANAHMRLRNYDLAVTLLEPVADAEGPFQPEALGLLALAQSRLGRSDLAVRSYDRALELSPDLAFAEGARAAVLQTQGDFEAANASFRRALELDPTNGENYRLYLMSHKIGADDPLIGAMQAQMERKEGSESDRVHIGFALAKVYEDLKDYDRAFAYLQEANKRAHDLTPYDRAGRRREIAQLLTAVEGFDWDAALKAAEAAQGTPDERTGYAPIFVTGMPRSGTTLIEQILASHSTVEGNGEVGVASRLAYELMAQGKAYRRLADILPSELAGIGRQYEAALRERQPTAARVTDKSILTYTYLGILKLAMPRAKFVVVKRDPRDNLLSIYKNKFPDQTHLYAYDQEDLVIHYGSFVEIVDYWRSKVPDWLYEIQYEDLVANPEEETRKLVAACGLEWEDACLSFHENKRRIDTLSVYQARQPISSQSVKSWQRYEAGLKPMLDALKAGGYVAD